MKEEVDPTNAEQAIEYVEKLPEKQMTLPSGNTVEFTAAAIKERKGKYTLILRYQIVKRPATGNIKL